MEIKNLSSGDRCNGGIEDVSEKNNQLTYGVNLTAYDFIALAKKNIATKAYDDLASCAACCVGKAFYKLNPQHLKPQLLYITLTNTQDQKSLPQQGTQADCFNQLFVSYTKAGEIILDKDKLEAFANQFKQNCFIQ